MSSPLWRRGDAMPDDLLPAVQWLLNRALERGYAPADRLAGISIGGCVDAHGTTRTGAMRRRAHAHIEGFDHVGWICVAAHGTAGLVTSTGLPSVLLRHEYAHLLAPRDTGHGQAWRRAVTALGAPGEAKAAAARSIDRKARLANTLYYHDNQLISREEYLQRTRR